MDLYCHYVILALAPPAQPGTQPNPTGELVKMIGMLVLMGAMFYFVLIRPQQKKARDHATLLKTVRPGDKILTTGGSTFSLTDNTSYTLKCVIGDDPITSALQELKVYVGATLRLTSTTAKQTHEFAEIWFELRGDILFDGDRELLRVSWCIRLLFDFSFRGLPLPLEHARRLQHAPAKLFGC